MFRWLIAAMTVLAGPTYAGEVFVAVASNFAAPMNRIAPLFEAQTGHKARLAIGSTGAFYAQIRNGAPFDVLLAADEDIPARLEKDGLAAPGTRFTYATGRLVLWSAKPGVVDAKGEVLKHAEFDKLAVANPKLAPYGQAAMDAMKKLGVKEKIAPHIVQAENIGQAFQFVATGNAQLGFVAMSQVMNAAGSRWVVPETLHAPLKQDAVVLKRAKDDLAAKELMGFLKGDTAHNIILTFGYNP